MPHEQRFLLVFSVLQIGRSREKNQNTVLRKKQTHTLRMPFFFTQPGSVRLYCFRFLSVGHPPTPHFTSHHRNLSVFQRLGRTSRSPGLRIPPVVHARSPPDQSFFYALDTPASSTQSSLGNLLPDSALVRLVSQNSQNQLALPPDYLSKSATDIPTPAQSCTISPSSFSQATPEIKNPPRVKRCSLLRRTPPVPPFLPIQTPPDTPILIEPKESSPSGEFIFHLHTPEPTMAHRRISHPYAQSPADPFTSTTFGFPRSPSQEFHSCGEQSPVPGPGLSSPASSSTPPINHLLGKLSSNIETLPPSLLVNRGGGSPFFASAHGNQVLTIPRPVSESYAEDTLGGQSPNIFTSGSTSAKIVPFSASARASVVSESHSYTSEHPYQGGTSPTVPRELGEYCDYVGPESVSTVSDGRESSQCQNGPVQPIGSSGMISCVEGSNLESLGAEGKPSFCAPGTLFPIPEEDTQVESSSSRSRSDPSSSSNGSLMVTAAGSLPSLPSSSYGEPAVSFISTSGSFPIANNSTPGISGFGPRPTQIGTGSLPITSTPAQIALRSTGTSVSPSNVGALRFGARESYAGSGDLNDGTEMSGACMNGLYEELEEWGCEWILQDQQPSSSTGRT